MINSELFTSKEYLIFERLKIVGDAYTRLVNSGDVSYLAAIEALRDLRLAVKDLVKMTYAAIVDTEPPPHLVRNVNAWSRDTLDSYYLNTVHHYMRYLHAQSDEQKVKELTAFYYLAEALQQIAEHMHPHFYYKELIL